MGDGRATAGDRIEEAMVPDTGKTAYPVLLPPENDMLLCRLGLIEDLGDGRATAGDGAAGDRIEEMGFTDAGMPPPENDMLL